MTFQGIAEVEFAISDTDQRITVANLPFEWSPTLPRDLCATQAALRYIVANESISDPLTLVSITTTPLKRKSDQ
jgi:hypothetical protein